MTVEHTAQHDLPHCLTRSQVFREEARGVVDDLRQQVGPTGGFHVALEVLDLVQELALRLAIPHVHRDGQPEVLTARPVRLEVRVVRQGQVRTSPVPGHVRPGKAVIGDPVELRQHRVHVGGAPGVADDQDPVLRGAEGVGRVPVIGPYTGGDDVLRVRPELRD